jgi:hypothetical protein
MLHPGYQLSSSTATFSIGGVFQFDSVQRLNLLGKELLRALPGHVRCVADIWQNPPHAQNLHDQLRMVARLGNSSFLGLASSDGPKITLADNGFARFQSFALQSALESSNALLDMSEYYCPTNRRLTSMRSSVGQS